MESKKMTKNQLDIMKVLWRSDEPLSGSDIVKKDSSLNINTVRSCLQTMLKNNWVAVDDIVYSGTVLSRRYKPALAVEDYLVENFTGITEDNFCSLITHLIAVQDNLEAIKKIAVAVQKRENELEQLRQPE